MSRRSAVLLFAGLAMMWGLSFPAITVGLRDIPPVLFASFRYGTGSVLLLAYVTVTTGSGDRVPTERRDVLAVVAGGVFLFAGNAFLFLGQQTVPSGVAAILQGLVPIVTTLWALALLDEHVTPVGAAGILLGFVGVALIVRPEPGSLLSTDLFGKLLILGQVLSVSLGGVLVERFGPSIPRSTLTGWGLGLGGVLLLAASLLGGESLAAAAFTRSAVVAIIYLGVFSTALAFLVYFTILEEYGALETSLVAYLVPVVATIAGIFILDESITLATIGGFVVVFLGFALLKRRQLADLAGWTGPAPGAGD